MYAYKFEVVIIIDRNSQCSAKVLYVKIEMNNTE